MEKEAQGLSIRKEGMNKNNNVEKKRDPNANSNHEIAYELHRTRGGGTNACHNCREFVQGDRYKTKSGEHLTKIFCIRCVIDLQQADKMGPIEEEKDHEFTQSELQEIRRAKQAFVRFVEADKQKMPPTTTPIVEQAFKELNEETGRKQQEVISILETMEESLSLS